MCWHSDEVGVSAPIKVVPQMFCICPCNRGQVLFLFTIPSENDPTNMLSFEEEKTMLPNEKGFYGEFGGRFVPEQLADVLEEVKQAFYKLKDDEKFNEEFR